MDKLSQVRGVLRAVKSIALQGVYAETFKGMESQCISTYRRCIATLKTVPGFEDVDAIAPELAEDATMQHIGFAVETILSLISESEGPAHGFPPGFRPGFTGFRGHSSHGMGRDMKRMVRMKMRHCGGRSECHVHGMGRGPGPNEEVRDKMQDEMEKEQERFEDSMEKIEGQIEELQEKIEEAREALEERLDGIREKYEERLEELREQDEDENDDDEDDKDKDEPKE